MREVGVTVARARWAELLRAVENGEQVAITRNGKAIARLVSPCRPEPTPQAEAVARFRAWRRRQRHVGMSVAEILAAIREGRR